MINNVFILGIDGAGRSIFNGECPNIDSVRKIGVTATNTRTVMPTISAQCWGSMFLSVLPEQHGYTNDNLELNPHEMDDIYPSLFRLIKEQLPDWQIASFASWSPINEGIIEDMKDIVKYSETDELMIDKAADYIRETKGNLAFFLHLDDLDHAGHTYDYFTPKYMEELKQIDVNIGKMLSAIKDSGRMDDSLILIVTDHGGGTIPKSHGTDGPKDIETFLIGAGGTLGKGIEVDHPVNIMDVAPVVLKQLGIPQPKHMLGNADALSE